MKEIETKEIIQLALKLLYLEANNKGISPSESINLNPITVKYHYDRTTVTSIQIDLSIRSIKKYDTVFIAMKRDGELIPVEYHEGKWVQFFKEQVALKEKELFTDLDDSIYFTQESQ